jgi:hypothetical protein
MQDTKTKIKVVLLIILAWLTAIALAYLVIMKMRSPQF